MKFQKLTIHNIASIEDAVIDFEAEPLAGSEVFLITGKTGAGKSTILDAICLALFDATPRLDSTRMQGETKDGDNEIKIKDTRQLMRRNTGEASITLTFTGRGGVHYEAAWAVARARKKLTGKIQKKDWQLTNLDTGHVVNKVKEVEAEIKSAIGLDFSQFCRTTMLAQGEFTRFLNSNDDDKAAILEKITGVDIYSKVGKKVYDLTMEKKQAWEDANRCVEGIRTLSDEEIAQRREQLKTLDAQQAALKAKKDDDTKRRDWLEADGRLAAKVAEAATMLDQAKAKGSDEDFTSKQNLVREWNETIDARKWLADAEAAQSELAKQDGIIKALADDYANMLGGLAYEEKETEGVRLHIKEIDAFWGAEKDKASAYENSQTIVSALNAMHNGRKAISKGEKDIAEQVKLLGDELKPRYDKAHKDAANAKEEIDKQDALVKALEDAISALHLADLRSQRDKAKDLIANVAKAKERIEDLAKAKAKHEETERDLTARLKDIEAKRQLANGKNSALEEAKQRLDSAQTKYEQQKNTIDKFAKAMRERLHVGDTCPVCRQKLASALPHEEDIKSLVDSLRENLDEAEKEYKALESQKNRLDAEAKALAETYGRDMASHQADKSVAQAEKKAMEACEACGIDALTDAAPSCLSAKEAEAAKLYNELDAKIAAGEKQEATAKAQRKEIDKKRKQLDALSKIEREAEAAINAAGEKKKEAEAIVNTKREDVLRAEQSAATLIGGVTFDVDWRKSPKAFGEALSAAAAAYRSKATQKQTLSSALSVAESQQQSVAAIAHGILESMPSWKGIKAAEPIKVEALADRAGDIKSNVAVAITRRKDAESVRLANMAQLDDFLSTHSTMSADRLKTLCGHTANSIACIDKELKGIKDDIVSKQSLLAGAQKDLALHREGKPALTEEDTIVALTAAIANHEKEIADTVEQRGGINQELKIDEENKQKLGALIKAAEDKHRVYERWSRMNQLIGDATGSKFRKIAQSYVLLSLIHSANSYMRHLTDRYTLRVEPGTFVIALEDAYQGYVSRAASTISGGESFLVSLSLALALSDIGQQWQVDTLFIDEGFGTLSGEPLQKAVDTLRSLQSKSGRHVGIISHVEELKERIPVQIQVNQEGNNSNSVISIVP